MERINAKQFILKCLVSAGIIYFLFEFINFRSVIYEFENIKLPYIGIAVLSAITRLFLSSLGLWLLIVPFKKINFMRFTELHWLTMCLGYFTPAQIGEASLAFLLKRMDINAKKTLAIFVFNKIIIFLLILISGITGLRYFGYHKLSQLILSIICVIFLFFLGIRRSRIYIRDNIVKKYFMRFYDFFRTISDILYAYPKFIFFNICLNIMNISAAGLTVFFCFKAMGLEIEYIKVLLIFLLARIPVFIPITISGLGLLEFGITYLFENLGFDSAKILSAALMLRILGISLALFIVLISLLGYRRLKKELCLVKENR